MWVGDMVRQPDKTEDTGTVDIPNRLVRESRSVKTKSWDTLYQAVGGYCLEISWWWRYDLSKKERNRIVSRTRMNYDSLSIFLLFGIV